LPYRYFRRISRIAKRKTGLYESNYLFLLEGRLVNFIYRTGIVNTIFKSLYLVKGGFISINNFVKTHTNALVKMFDIVSFSPLIRINLYLNYLLNLNN